MSKAMATVLQFMIGDINIYAEFNREQRNAKAWIQEFFHKANELEPGLYIQIPLSYS